jgi:hypothetical protein
MEPAPNFLHFDFGWHNSSTPSTSSPFQHLVHGLPRQVQLPGDHRHLLLLPLHLQDQPRHRGRHLVGDALGPAALVHRRRRPTRLEDGVDLGLLRRLARGDALAGVLKRFEEGGGVAGKTEAEIQQIATNGRKAEAKFAEKIGEGTEAAANSLKALGSNCFVAGTPLLTVEGDKAIELFHKGDRILSRSEFDPDGPLEVKLVEEVFVRVAPILTLIVEGRIIRTTAEHPFYLLGQGWRCAKELQTGDWLISHERVPVRLEEVRQTAEVATVYNLRVADYHTYFVGCQEWGFSVWAHNANYVLVQEGRDVFRLYQLEANGTRTAVRDAAGQIRTFTTPEEALQAVRSGTAPGQVTRFQPNVGTHGRDWLREGFGANPYPVDAEAHHILSANLFDTPLGQRLQGWGIDLNSSVNGVLLPRQDYVGRVATLHRGRTSGAYNQAVVTRLEAATTRERALEILAELKDDLLHGRLRINNAQ